MAVKIINGLDVELKVKDGLHIVNVFGTWCGPCKMFAPILEDISKEEKVYKIDIDKNHDFAKKMQIKGVPTTLIFKDGSLKDTIVGFVPKDVLLERVNKI